MNTGLATDQINVNLVSSWPTITSSTLNSGASRARSRPTGWSSSTGGRLDGVEMKWTSRPGSAPPGLGARRIPPARSASSTARTTSTSSPAGDVPRRARREPEAGMRAGASPPPCSSHRRARQDIEADHPVGAARTVGLHEGVVESRLDGPDIEERVNGRLRRSPAPGTRGRKQNAVAATGNRSGSPCRGCPSAAAARWESE